MALFTKLFDRDHSPYSIPGARWYKIVVASDGTTPSIVSSDPGLNARMDGTSDVAFNTGNKSIISYHLSGDISAGSAYSFQKRWYITATGSGASLKILNPDRYTKLTVFIFM